MSHLVISYDVVSDRRRARLSKLLKTKLERVQKSVFEGDLPEPVLERLKSRMSGMIDHETDSIRIYQLCRRCAPALEIIGTGTPTLGPEEDVLL